MTLNWPILNPPKVLTTLAAACLVTLAHAGPSPLVAAYDGSATIVEVIDPAVPVVRFETVSTGFGSFDLSRYFSTDIVLGLLGRLRPWQAASLTGAGA